MLALPRDPVHQSQDLHHLVREILEHFPDLEHLRARTWCPICRDLSLTIRANRTHLTFLCRNGCPGPVVRAEVDWPEPGSFAWKWRRSIRFVSMHLHP
jgi:hypothetical protein